MKYRIITNGTSFKIEVKTLFGWEEYVDAAPHPETGVRMLGSRYYTTYDNIEDACDRARELWGESGERVHAPWRHV